MNDPVLPPSLRARVLESVRREPVPSRSIGGRRRAAALAAGFGLTAVIAAKIGAHPGARPHTYIVVLAAAWLAVAAAATWAAFGRGTSMLGRSTRVKWLAALAPLMLLVTWAVAARLWPTTAFDTSGPSDDVRCTMLTLAFAVGPLAALAWTRKGSDPLSPGLSGAALGAAAGSWAALALFILCEATRPAHMMLGHVLPVVGVVVAGAILGDRVLAIRTKSG